MSHPPYRSMRSIASTCAVLALAFLTDCAMRGSSANERWQRLAFQRYHQAAKKALTTEQRAALYLDTIKVASRLLDDPSSSRKAKELYNQATADLVLLLRSAEDGAFWNQTHTLAHEGLRYRLRFSNQKLDGLWNPDFFTSLIPADQIKLQSIEKRHRIDGVGAAMVGIRKVNPREPFSSTVGVTARVTVWIDMRGQEAVVSLVDPSKQSAAFIAGKKRTLAADFTAPLAYYPQRNAMVEGMLGALRVQKRMGATGLYMIQPYDPERIPVVFVHGLISIPQMWRNVINEIESDPLIRSRYQCFVFAYPTGNPPLYSALRLREEIDQLYQHHPQAKKMILIGHSMGGILSRTQVAHVEREDWNVIGEQKAHVLFRNVKPGCLVDRAMTFSANPHVDRAIFICSPHRGSEMAVGSLGELAIRLIQLPSEIVYHVSDSIGQSIAIVTGNPNRIPNSIDGLSPKNPTLQVLDRQNIEVPHHSIIGDRGKADTPLSSDGVVKYWSSHLPSAASEKIVPGSHSACELPETIEELKRILALHLNEG
jgi:hypothetical protein